MLLPEDILESTLLQENFGGEFDSNRPGLGRDLKFDRVILLIGKFETLKIFRSRNIVIIRDYDLNLPVIELLQACSFAIQ
jgi:hypothetical protein